MQPSTGVVGCADIAMLSSLLNKSDSLEGRKKKKQQKKPRLVLWQQQISWLTQQLEQTGQLYKKYCSSNNLTFHLSIAYPLCACEEKK